MALLPDNKKPQPTSVSPVKPQRKGTGFTNLARVMQASQGSKLGQTIAGGITGQAQQVQSGIKTAQEEFQKEAERNRIDTELNRGRVTSAIGNIINPTTSGPKEPSSEDLSLFTTIRSGEYKGPTELANQQQLQAQAQQAQTLGSLASGVGQRSGTDQGGRQALLSRFVGGSDYTSGQRKLDESILSKDKESNLASAARQTRGVAEEAQRATAGAQAKGQEYGSLAGLFKKEVNDKITDAQTPINQQLIARVAKITTDEGEKQTFIDALGKQLKTNAILNLSPADSAAKLNELLQQEQYKKYIPAEAIDSLTGQSDNFINRAVALGKDPSKQLLESIIAKSTQGQNVSRAGIVSSDPELYAGGQKLDNLSRLLGKEGTDLEFSKKGPEYKAGTVASGFTPFKKEVYLGEKQKSDDLLAVSNAKVSEFGNILKNAVDGVGRKAIAINPDGTARLDVRKDYISPAGYKQLQNLVYAFNYQFGQANAAKMQSDKLGESLKQIQDEENALAIEDLQNT